MILQNYEGQNHKGGVGFGRKEAQISQKQLSQKQGIRIGAQRIRFG
jgi:hypothetical protein